MEQIPHEFDTPINTFASGYNLQEKIAFIKNRVRPSRQYAHLTTSLPTHSVVNAGVAPAITLGFTGDVMPIKGHKLVFSDELRAFYASCDYLVVNMEGIITEKERYLALSHRHSIAGYLAELFPPERTLVYVANNHSGDFGYRVFQEQYAWLKDHFGHVFGAHDEGNYRLGNLNFASVTDLSNQICHYVPWLKDADSWYDSFADFNVLLPHWGYEMQLYPHPKQIETAKRLVKKWNLVAGNHSHCPQPVTAYKHELEQRAVIYSMGNFCYHHRWPTQRFGKIARVGIGLGQGGAWQTGTLDWAYTRHDLQRNNELIIHITNKAFKL